MKNKSKINKKQNRFWKWTKRISIGIIIFLLLTIVTGFISLQFKSVRQTVINYALTGVNEGLNAQLHIDDFSFLSYNSLNIYDATLTLDGDTIAYVPEIFTKVNIWGIPNEVISTQFIHLRNPELNMIMDSTGKWSLEKIAKPSTGEPSTADPKVILNNVKFIDGKFRLYNPYSSTKDIERINTSDMYFEKFYFSGDFYIRPAKRIIKADFNDMNFYESVSKHNVEDVDFSLNIDSTKTILNDLYFKSNETEINIDVDLTEIDLLDGPDNDDLKNSNVKFNVSGKNVDLPELSSILSLPLEFNGTADISAEGSGKLNYLNVDKFDFNLNDTYLSLKGSINELLSPENIHIDLRSENSIIYQNDLQSFLGNDDPSFPNFYKGDVKYLNVKGKPENLNFELDINTKNGNLVGIFNLSQVNSKTNYKYDGTVRNLNAGNILKNKDFKSNLNGKLKLSAVGDSPENIKLNVKFNGRNSSFNEYKMSKLIVNTKIDAFEKFELDTLYTEFGQREGFMGDPVPSYITGKGSFDISSKKSSNYDLMLNYSALNLRELTKIEDLPSYISGTTHLNAQGLEIDSITGNFETVIDDIVFDDRAFFPFSFTLEIENYPPSGRSITFDSDFGEITLEGEYNFETLLSSFSNQGAYLANFIINKINTVIPDEQGVLDEIELLEVDKIDEFKPINANLIASIEDFSFISAFLDSIDLRMIADMNFHIFSDSVESSLFINKLDVSDIYFEKYDDIIIKSSGLTGTGGLYVKLQDSVAAFSDFELDIKAEDNITINELELNKPSVILNYDGENFDFNANSNINKQIDINIEGKSQIIPGGLSLKISVLDLNYMDKYDLALTEPLEAEFIDGGFDIMAMNFQNPKTSEEINLTGKFDSYTNSFENFNVNVINFEISNLKPFISEDNKESLEQFTGNIDSLDVTVNGDLDNPTIKFDLNSSNIKVNKQLVGNINADLIHEDHIITGDLYISDYTEDDEIDDLITGKINSFPFDLSLKDVENRFSEDVEADMIFNLDSLPLSIISPIVPAVSYLRGFADGELQISGFLPDNLNYDGKISINNTSFVVDATNVAYKADGIFLYDNKRVNIDKLRLYNLRKDVRNGRADISGYIDLEKFQPKYFDFAIKSGRLLVLNEESQKVKDDLYGRLIISSGRDSLRFHGSLDEPNLDGYLAIESADLKMPQDDEVQLVKTNFVYESKNNLLKVKMEDDSDTSKVVKLDEANKQTASLMDLMNIDLDVEFKGKTSLDMTINKFISTKVLLGTPITLNNIRFVKNRNEEVANLYGKIILKEGSKLNFIKTFDITGEINFPTGNIANPTLDLQAQYEGRTTDHRNYEINIYITGTKEKPEMRYEYTLANQKGYGDPNKILGDILSLLLFNRLNNQSSVAESENQNLNIENTIASDLLSRQMSEILSEYGLTAQVEIGESFEDARVKIRGEFIGGATWTFGGDVNDISGSRFEIEIPFDDFLGLSENQLLNLLLKFTYVNSPETVQSDVEQIHWEIKFKLGGNW